MSRLITRDKHEPNIFLVKDRGFDIYYTPEDRGYEAISKLNYLEDLEEQLMESAEIDIDNMIGEFMHDYKLKKENRLITIEPVKGYEDHYGVDRFGNVYSLKGGKVVKRTLSLNKSGYYYVSLKDNDKIKNARVHRLVAEAFIPNPENKPYINHIDGNKTNNCVDNLEWCTPSENSRHALSKGLLKPPINKVDGVWRNGKNKFAVIHNTKDNTCTMFSNTRKASKYLGRGHNYIWQQLAKGKWEFSTNGFDVYVFLTKEEAEAKLKELEGDKE